MIRYDLTCEKGHGFDAWFRDSAGFETERAAGRVACPLCGATEVEKALMAPAVAKGRAAPPAPAKPAEPGAPVPTLSAPPEHPLHRALGALRDKLEREARYVGGSFAAEARAMHDGAAEAAPIWGEATAEEAKALIEDGAPVAPLPPLPRRDD